MPRACLIAGVCLLTGCVALRAPRGDQADGAGDLLACANLDGEMPAERLKLLGYFQPDPTQGGEWRDFQREKDLQRGAERGEIYSTAEVWKYSDGTLRILETLGSPSGDWLHYLDYCFRADGTLARSISTLNTFNRYNEEHDDLGPISRKNDRVFDKCGTQLQVQNAPLVDLKTNLEAPAHTQIMDQGEPLVTHIRDVPFWSLLQQALPNTALQLPAGCAGRS